MGKIRNLAPNEYYHVCCRIIGGEHIFKNKYIAERFLATLILANSEQSARAFEIIRNAQRYTREATKWAIEFTKFYPILVDILSFTLLGNHFHFLLKNLEENNISKFMQRFNTAITMFTNKFLNRKGHLFQSAFKCIHIKDNVQLLHSSLYIFLNILDNFDKDWREGKLKNWERAKNILVQYPYSNFAEFIGVRDINFISGHEIIKNQFKTPEEYFDFLKSWACGGFDPNMGSQIIIEP